MKSYRIVRRRRDERGAIAILVAVLSVALFLCAALAVDISKQVNYRHELKNQLDASAVAAAYYLQTKATGCDPAQPSKTCLALAVGNAASYYKKHYGQDLDLRNVDFWCVVARRQTTTTPFTPTTPAQAALYQIPTTSYGSGVCNPDAAAADSGCASPKTCFQISKYANMNRTWDGTKFSMTCSDQICAIPCGLKAGPSNNWAAGTSSLNTQSITCNTIRVSSERGVPFSFAPAGGIDNGSTGTQISVACRGSCGSIAANPMDVVVVSDRTGSMEVVDRNAMVNGIRSMLGVMTPAQQFVSLGTIGRSKTTTRSTAACGSGGLTAASTNANSGQWVPLKFYDDYLNSSGALNASSNIAKALSCIDSGSSSTGTALAAPLKGAARYVLGSGYDSNNVQTELDGNSRVGEIRKVVIFETDGQPNEQGTANSSTSLSSTADPMSPPDAYTSVQANSPSTVNKTDVAPSQLGISTTPASSYKVGSTTYNIRYNQNLTTTDRRYTYTMNGGQQACKNFQTVATAAKDAGILVITIGYNLDSSIMCGQDNAAGPGNSSTTTYNSHYISNIIPTTSTGAATSPANTWNPNVSSCRSGSGTSSSPYVLKTSTCKSHVRITYTSTATLTGSITVSDLAGDQGVTNVLASAAGGNDVPPSDSNGCMTATTRGQENGDGDFFFCAASGDDMGPIFQTALSQVSTGIKLLSNLPK